MKTKFSRLSLTVISSLALSLAIAGMASAKDQTTHIRGTITNVSAHQIQLKTREGDQKTVVLNDESSINGLVDSSLDQVKKGTFIGTANVDKGDGHKALEVVVFPKSMAGRGLGNYSWDLAPSNVRGTDKQSQDQTSDQKLDLSGSSSMTNGTVTQASGSGQMTVQVDYGKGSKSIEIAQDTPVVAVQKASHQDLKSGAKVFVIADQSNQPPTGNLVLVGINGTVPPM